jgi:hypothetical protein
VPPSSWGFDLGDKLTGFMVEPLPRSLLVDAAALARVEDADRGT